LRSYVTAKKVSKLSVSDLSSYIVSGAWSLFVLTRRLTILIRFLWVKNSGRAALISDPFQHFVLLLIFVDYTPLFWELCHYLNTLIESFLSKFALFLLVVLVMVVPDYKVKGIDVHDHGVFEFNIQIRLGPLVIDVWHRSVVVLEHLLVSLN
jgi:hypothetical protein